MAQPTADEMIAHLTRLSQKPGVQSTLIISRETGAIVRTSGLISSSENANAESVLPSSDTVPPTSTSSTPAPPPSSSSVADGNEARPSSSGGLRSAEDVARLVWAFFGKAGDMVEELMGTEDECRLLRLRTKRNELMIVPDPKYLLVVIHDTPPA